MSLSLSDLFDCCFGNCLDYYYPGSNDIDIMTFSFVAILLVVVFAYHKINSKSDVSTINLHHKNVDILMQPKSEFLMNTDTLPFSKLSSKSVYYRYWSTMLIGNENII